MTDIQRARDVLAKWRNQTTITMAESVRMLDFPLVIGTAGNPDLLDAIDSLLATSQRDDLRALGLGPLLYDAERVAETIVSADERMSA